MQYNSEISITTLVERIEDYRQVQNKRDSLETCLKNKHKDSIPTLIE